MVSRLPRKLRNDFPRDENRKRDSLHGFPNGRADLLWLDKKIRTDFRIDFELEILNLNSKKSHEIRTNSVSKTRRFLHEKLFGDASKIRGAKSKNE